MENEEIDPKLQATLNRLAEENAMVDDIMNRGITEDRAEAIIYTGGYFAGRDAVLREQAEAASKTEDD